ncbi:MAG: small multi-drug export protein [Patescibacteria group bacterium]
MLNELITFIVAALPLSELRGAIPLAMLKFGFSPAKAFLISFLGNVLPVLPLLIGMEKVSGYLIRHFRWFKRFFSWLFERTRAHHEDHFRYWGNLALFIFVAIPLPLTGAYSGALAAFVFGIPKKHAFWSITIGVFFAGLIMTFATLLGDRILKYLFL